MSTPTTHKKEITLTEIFGMLLILFAVGGFIATAVLSITDMEKVQNGTLPAISFLILIIGITFYFPTLLEESTGEMSTMRIIVLIVVLVFATINIKLGWLAGSFEDFVIDSSWIYILGLAFGAKAFQKFAEEDDGTPTTKA